ncbi:MAG: hypothetical protein V4556_13165 [Bacteroidota bacterium]
MSHKEELEEMHRLSQEKFQHYLDLKKEISKEDHEKIHQLRSDWDVAWNKLMETLLMLERLEI